MKLFCCFIVTYNLLSSHSYFDISSTGGWIGKDLILSHAFDESLCNTLVDFFHEENVISIADFGCGKGQYVKRFISSGFLSYGFDANPVTEAYTQGQCSVIDLTDTIDLAEKPDWILSLEVGEHIPKEFESAFIQNLTRNAKKGIIISWAIKGQGGYGHFNEQNNKYIKNLLYKFGFINDLKTEKKLRKNLLFLGLKIR